MIIQKLKIWRSHLVLLLTLLEAGYTAVNAQSIKTYRFISDPVKLAERITRNDTSDEQKAISIYTWVTYNIKYDARRFYTWDTDGQDTRSALKKRKTLCTGISNIVKEMCIASGIQAIVVNGYVKTLDYDLGDTTYLPTHSWNKIRVDGVWLNADATWDLGAFSLYKTSAWRQFWAKTTFGLVSAYTFNPQVKQEPGMRYFLKDDNCFAVDHLPENPDLQNFLSPMMSIEFDEDSAAYYWKDSLMRMRHEQANSYINQYAGLERIVQDKLDAKKAREANPLNQWGMTRYNYYELKEKWEHYRSNEALKYDSIVLKEIIRISDSVSYYSDSNRYNINHEKEVLLHKYRKKLDIQKAYNSDYRRYLKSIRHQRTHLKMLLRKNKHQIKKRSRKLGSQMLDMRISHIQDSKWPKTPSGRGVDSLSMVFRLYTDSLRANEERTRELLQRIPVQVKVIDEKAKDQVDYINRIVDHFTVLAYYRIYAQDDYDYVVFDEKSKFLHHNVFDSTLAYKKSCDSLKSTTDSLYRLIKISVRLLKRQESLLRRIQRKTIDRSQYYALNDQYKNNAKLLRYDINQWMSSAINKVERAYEITSASTPVKEAQSVARFERKIHLGSSFIREKAKWHHRRNNALYKYARRVRTRALAKLEFSRIKAARGRE